MSETPLELDLKFLPAWLKEGPSTNRYADFEGEREGRRDERDGRRGPSGGQGDRRGPRPPQGRGGPPRDQRDSRGDRGPGKGGRFGKPQGSRGPRSEQDFRGPRPQPEAPPAPVVRVGIFPEPAAAAGIAKQIKGSSRACGVFHVAKMFLDRAERYRVRITALDPAAMMYQAGDGPVSFDRAAVEGASFRANLDQFYVTEIVQGDAPKGNYTSIARERLSGVLLGPPNHHGYQVALRKLYEDRYSRRMSFPDFQRNIDIVTDPAAVEQWKQQSSSVTTYKTKVGEGEEATIFKSLADVEAHFRATHLPKLVRSGNSLEVSGTVASSMLDRRIGFSVRDAVEHERHVPVQMVNALRPYFVEAGLHLFKWKRKILFASSIRPQRHPAEQTFSDGISAILTAIGERPGMKRPQLATRLLGALPADAPEAAVLEAAAKKEALAADLHYLIQIGYVVEFQIGTLELPPARREAGHQQHADDGGHDVTAETAALKESTREAKPAQAAESPAKSQRRAGCDYQILLLQIAASLA